MHSTQDKSISAPRGLGVGRLVVEASRRAEAMGLINANTAAGSTAGPHGGLTVRPNHEPPADLVTVRNIARQAGKAGIAMTTVAVLHNVEAPTPDELAVLLRTMIAALEASPVPKFEWSGVARVLDADQLASLLHVSSSSLKRYQSGERTTPDPIAARLHFLALVVGDLAGSYNDIGVRRWFHRKRTLLDGRAPTQLLTGEWDPDDAGPRRVRELARELVTLTAT